MEPTSPISDEQPADEPAGDEQAAPVVAATVHDLTVTREPVGSLHTYYRNPRQGSVETIAASLRVNGQYRPIVANRGTYTGRPREVLAGNHTLKGARHNEWADVAVCWVDVDDDAAARIVAADNRTADLGSYDDRLLAELLGELPDLDGTGFDPGDLDDLIAALEETGPPPKSDRLGADGVNQTRSLTEQKQLYDDADTRTIVLAYPLVEFERVIDGLGELAEHYDVDSNAAVVLHLVEKALAGEPVEDVLAGDEQDAPA